LASQVALVDCNRDIQEAYNQALTLIGGIADLNTAEKSAVIKVGVFKHKGPRLNHPTVRVVSTIANSFTNTPQIYLAESDNYKGTGSERLQIYKDLFTKRVVPFNLSDDTETREVPIAGEKMNLSHILFKPNVLISTHGLRRYDKGTILKNLFGLVPERKKARLHKKLVSVLLDTFEAVGGIDLAVLDATRTYSGPAARRSSDTNVLVVGRDAVAVEAVGATLVGLKPDKMPVIQEAVNRGLGEGNLDEIEIVGAPIESIKERFQSW